MITTVAKQQIINIWKQYVDANQVTYDTKGKILNNINDNRIKCIIDIKEIISNFLANKIDIYEFKTTLDSYNKRNNLWGFTAAKGQMFFNQLVRNNETKIDELSTLLKKLIIEPIDLNDALIKIGHLEKLCTDIFSVAKDKRKAPNPGSVGYFLSYFWQIHDNTKWPIIYTSLLTSFKDLGIWQEQNSQRDNYRFFYNLNNDIISLLEENTNKKISNWDAEHAFWNHGNSLQIVTQTPEAKEHPKETSTIIATFDLKDYLIPKISNLVELGEARSITSAVKGAQYERAVAEIFRLLDFEVEILGQGTGRNPDAIIKYREENTAFIVDAKAYTNGYVLGTDDRAIKEYISYYSPKLIKEGYKKIGFILVSNSFRYNFDSFINDITWNTDIKRFTLLTSEALLYMLAYKIKDKLGLSTIIENIVGMSSPITATNIIEKLDDF